MIAIKKTNTVVGLDGITRTWAVIEKEYLEQLNPDVSSKVIAIENIASDLFAQKNIFKPKTKIKQKELGEYLMKKYNIDDYNNEIKDFTSEITIAQSFYKKAKICPSTKISTSSLSYKIYNYLNSEEYKKLKSYEQKFINKFLCFFDKNIESVLLASDNSFKINSIIKTSKYPFLKHFFEKYLYKWLREEYGYWFANVLGIKVCPYCNNQFVLSVNELNKDKKALYQLDHILPKADFPYLAISLYNLIPSCASCNNAKRTSSGFFNPYTESFHHNAKFILENKKFIDISNRQSLKSAKLKLEALSEATKVQKHIDTFYLEGIYEIHKDIVEELYWKKGIYIKGYNKEIRARLKKFGLQESEVEEALKRFILGNYHKEEDFHKRIHTKLTHDIAQELGLL